MPAFIDVVDDPYAWTSEAVIHQLAAAINERAAAAGRPHPRIDEPKVGDVIQSANFWIDMMQAVDTLIPYFVNDYLYPDFDAEPTIVMYNRTTFSNMLAARTDVDFSFWRTSTPAEDYDADLNDWTDEDDAMYSTTIFEPASGHRIGPWMVKMLQDHLKYLITTKECLNQVPAGYGPNRRWSFSQSGTTCALAQTNIETAYGSASWTYENVGIFYRAQTTMGYVTEPTAYYFGDTERWRSIPRLTGIWPNDIHSAKSYLFMEAEGTWDDVDSLGVTQDTWHLWETFGDAETGERTCSPIGDISASPLSLQTYFCPTLGAHGIESRTNCWTLEWDFDQEYDWEGYSSSSESESSESSESSSSSSSSSDLSEISSSSSGI